MTTSIDEFRIAPAIRTLNTVGAVLEKGKIRLLDLRAEALVETACRKTGLSDWGDAQFMADYRVLMSAFERNEKLTLLGRFGMRLEFMRVLTNRLRIQDAMKAEPGIRDLPVQRPLFILGLPRTGTTLLHKLLAQDPNAYVPPLWQLLRPLPLTAPQQEIGRRIKEAEQMVRYTYYSAPTMRAMHHMNATEPEECVFLLPHHLVHHGRGDVPEYVQWFLERDAVPDYEYYKQQIQALQWQQPAKRWVMKSPFHLFTLDALFKVFPDACIIQTHRDPKKVIGSWCSFQAAVGQLHRKQIDFQHIGQDWLALWQAAMERAMAVREAAGNGRCFDIHYAEFMNDPVGMVRAVYEHFGFELDDETEDRMRDWLGSNIQDKYGVHRYSIEQFRLDDKQIHEAFGHYIERFDVQLE